MTLTLQEIIRRKPRFLGHELDVTQVDSGEPVARGTICDILPWGNGIEFALFKQPPGKVALSEDEIATVEVSSDPPRNEFFIKSRRLSCLCR